MKHTCSHFGLCGGCSYQNLPYDEQLKQKEAHVQALFTAFNPLFYPILGGHPWEYRNKMEFSFSQSKAGEQFLGLMMKRGRVLNLEECHLVKGWFIDVLKATKEFWRKSGYRAFHPFKNSGTFRTLTLREGINTGEKMAFLTISGNPEDNLSDEAENEFKAALLAVCDLDAILIRRQVTEKKKATYFVEKVLHGRDHFFERMGEFEFKVRPSSFFQPNTKVAEQLYQRAIELGELEREETLFDLYCGTGTIGIFASKRVKKVVGIELNPDAILDAKENMVRNGIANMEVIEGDVGELLDRLPPPDCIIVDPPRVGLSQKALEALAALSPKKIVYISCNPLTQVENVRALTQFGYRVSAVQPVDQFPHTPHIENIVALRR